MSIEPNKLPNLDNLPPELLAIIKRGLPPQDLNSLAQVARVFNNDHLQSKKELDIAKYNILHGVYPKNEDTAKTHALLMENFGMIRDNANDRRDMFAEIFETYPDTRELIFKAPFAEISGWSFLNNDDIVNLSKLAKKIDGFFLEAEESKVTFPALELMIRQHPEIERFGLDGPMVETRHIIQIIQTLPQLRELSLPASKITEEVRGVLSGRNIKLIELNSAN